MSTVPTLPQSRPLTRADLATMPHDGHRYELIDGTLVVSPAPSFRHQRAVGRLHLLLEASCPQGLIVMLSPFAVGLADGTEVQPDLLMAPRSAFTERDRSWTAERPFPVTVTPSALLD